YENGFNTIIAYKKIEYYQEKAFEILKENPYRLIEDIENIGFVRADNFAEKLGVESDNPSRMKAGLYFALQENCLSNGATYGEKDRMIQKAIAVLEKSRPFMIAADKMEEYLDEMIQESRIVEEDGRYFLPASYYAGKDLACMIEDFISGSEKAEMNNA